MRQLTALAATGVTLVALALPVATTSAATTRNCGPVFTPTGDTGPVRVTGTTCRTGRAVAKGFAVKGRYKGWSCTAKPYEGGANATCRKVGGTATVRFQVAD